MSHLPCVTPSDTGGKPMERYVRFLHEEKVSYGLLMGEEITVLRGEDFASFQITEKRLLQNEVQLLTPCTPSKAVCVGLNYSDTILEPGVLWPKEPLLFIKPSTSLLHPSGSIIKWPMIQNLVYEAELAVVISKKAHLVSQENAHEYIWGYTIANDVTARDLQKKDVLWARSKSFDTFLPLGPWITRGIQPGNLGIASYINGKKLQDGNTSKLIFGVEYLISFISHVTTLLPGDVILTGTPGGYGVSIDVGDIVEIEIEHLGKLLNTVKR